MTKAKDKQKANILENAAMVFLEKGMFETSMEDIAGSSGVTRRTLYRYFETREELAHEVLLQMMEKWNRIICEKYARLTGSGIEQLERFLFSLINYMKDHRDFMRFTGEFDFYFKDDRSFRPHDDLLKRFEGTLHLSEELIGTIINRGVEDGSIQNDGDMNLLVYTITNVLWSFGQRIAIRGKGIEEEFGLDPIEMIYCQVDLYIRGLKNNV